MVRAPTDKLPPVIAHQLGRLRRAVYFWLAVRGLSGCVLLAAALAGGSLLLDWTWRLDFYQRAVVLALMLILLFAAVARRLWRPLAQRLEDSTLCWRVEAVYPQLHQDLVSAAQLARERPAARGGVSPVLVEATIRRGVAAVAGLDFRRALEPRFVQRSRGLAILALSLAAAGGAGLIAPASRSILQLWWSRNLFLSDAQWPQRTHLTIKGLTGSTLTLPHGDDWDLTVESSGVVPATVYLDLQETSPVPADTTQEMTPLGRHEFHAVLRNLWAPLRFRVRGGDAQSPWITVALQDRPRVETWRLLCHPPAYTGQATSELKTDQAEYAVLKGSSLEVTALTNRPLRSAELAWMDQSLQHLTPVAPQRLAFTITPPQLQTGVYSLTLTACDGLASRQPARLAVQVVGDRPPTVQARLRGIGGLATPRATAPLTVRCADDYAVTRVDLICQATLPEQDKLTTQAVALPELTAQLPAREVSRDCQFELAPFQWPVGTQLSFHLEAQDNDNVSGPNVGSSANFYLKLVSDGELRTDLLRREQEQSQELERLFREQEELRTDIQALLATRRSRPEFTAAQCQILVNSEKRQRLEAPRCAAMAEQFQQFLAELVNNKLEDGAGPAGRRMREKIIGPLTDLSRELIPLAADGMNQARQESGPPAQRDQRLKATLAAQDQVSAVMRQALAAMAKWESYQEAVALLSELLKTQDQVHGATVKELQQRVQEIFDAEPEKK